jgi:ATP synthase protein I
MTTATSRLVLGPTVASTIVGLVLVVLGAFLSGADAAAAAAIGAVAVTLVFAFGATTVGVVARMVPSLSLLLALITYALQLAVVTAVFAALANGGALDATVNRTWLAGAVIASTLVWTVALVVANMRARVLLYDVPSQRMEANVR